jgi:hypothetical protein
VSVVTKGISDAIAEYSVNVEGARATACRRLLFVADINRNNVTAKEAQAVLEIVADLDPDNMILVLRDGFYLATLDHLRDVATQDLMGEGVGL